MHIATYKKTKRAPSDTPNKNGTQQKKHPLMPFENNDTLQKQHMTNTPHKIDKYNTLKNGSLQNGTPCKKIPKGHMPRAGMSDLLKGILKFVV